MSCSSEFLGATIDWRLALVKGCVVEDSSSPFRKELEVAIAAALAAGSVVRDLYDRAAAASYEKTDGSPVTDADLAADNVIRTHLASAFPDDALLTEEGQDDTSRLSNSRCWIVDPIDGTEQFIQRTGEFDILIALVEDGYPVVGVGYQPTTDTLVYASEGGGAWVKRGESDPERLWNEEPAGRPRIATSKWFGAPGNLEILAAVATRLGSTPMAPGVTGFAPRIFLAPRLYDAMVGIRAEGPHDMAHEWDFCAADIVIAESGGKTTDLAGNFYRYNKERAVNEGGLVVAVTAAVHAQVLAAVQAEGRAQGVLP
jgi:3'-phosphoadenosine 5'-phosphosulfate (PAPS) 3'-phosphatase